MILSITLLFKSLRCLNIRNSGGFVIFISILIILLFIGAETIGFEFSGLKKSKSNQIKYNISQIVNDLTDVSNNEITRNCRTRFKPLKSCSLIFFPFSFIKVKSVN